MEIDAILHGVKQLGLDTAPIIYFVEANPRYDNVVGAIFKRIADGEIEAVTSIITLTEVLVHPLKHQRTDLQNQYRNLLTNSAHFTIHAIDEQIAEQSAILRIRHNIRTPDALQIATVLAADCDAFLTNDKKLRRVNDLKIIVLEDLLG